jgi:hypothetical protein
MSKNDILSGGNMPVKAIRGFVQIPGRENIVYLTCDNKSFHDYEVAVKHDNDYHAKNTPSAVYEQVWTIQEAINKAVAERRVVRFLTNKSNLELKKGIVDLKGCKLMKPDRESKDVAVIPAGINNFDFNDVDTSLTVKGN